MAPLSETLLHLYYPCIHMYLTTHHAYNSVFQSSIVIVLRLGFPGQIVILWLFFLLWTVARLLVVAMLVMLINNASYHHLKKKDSLSAKIILMSAPEADIKLSMVP